MKIYDFAFRCFFPKIHREESGCHIWLGATHSAGYGNLRFEGKTRYTHVFAWGLVHGVWPTKFICHTCDNRKCVNIEHLFEGTCKENAQDAARKNRMGRPHTLSMETRQKIREELAQGLQQRFLATKYGTSQATISEINRGVHEHRNRSQDAKS